MLSAQGTLLERVRSLDEAQRAFFARAFARRRGCVPGFVHVCPNVDAVRGACGFRVTQQRLPFRTSTVAILPGGGLATRNVRRLDLATTTVVDGDAVDVPEGAALPAAYRDTRSEALPAAIAAAALAGSAAVAALTH